MAQELDPPKPVPDNRGGRRPGAGRKKGTRNKVNHLRVEKAKQSGALPGDILLDIARYHYINGIGLRDELKKVQAQAKKPKTPEEKQEHVDTMRGIEAEIRAEHAMAVTAGEKAAPYYHSKLATIPPNQLPNAHTLRDLIEESFRLGQEQAANSNAALPAPDTVVDVDIMDNNIPKAAE